MKPDGYLSDGRPVYLKCTRGITKQNLQLEMYRKLCGVPDNYEEMKREIAKILVMCEEDAE